jgi:hypothetical protein
MRAYARNIRLAILDMLGNRCACNEKECWHSGQCTIIDKRCLHVDHKKGGGTKEIDFFKANLSMYKFYIDHPIRAKRDLQLLCANCNSVKKYLNKEGTLGDVYPVATAATPQIPIAENQTASMLK